MGERLNRAAPVERTGRIGHHAMDRGQRRAALRGQQVARGGKALVADNPRPQRLTLQPRHDDGILDGIGWPRLPDDPRHWHTCGVGARHQGCLHGEIRVVLLARIMAQDQRCRCAVADSIERPGLHARAAGQQAQAIDALRSGNKAGGHGGESAGESRGIHAGIGRLTL